MSVKDSVYEIVKEGSVELPEEIILSTCSSMSDMRLILKCIMAQ